MFGMKVRAIHKAVITAAENFINLYKKPTLTLPGLALQAQVSEGIT